MSRSLDAEIAYFDSHREDLVAGATKAGKPVALIHNREIRGYFDTVVEAAQQGYRDFGNDLFLARSVVEEDHEPVLASIFRR